MVRGQLISRRDLLATGTVAVTTGAMLGTGGRAMAQEAVPYSTGTELPQLKPPAYTCDCHHHIYDSRFPPAASATLKPPDAHVADYRLLQQRLGTTRNVLVQPSTYGTDNRCTLEGLSQLGNNARAVAVVDTSVTDAELKRLADAGVRGIRFNLVQTGATTVEMLEPLSARVNELGWHVQIHMKGDGIAEIEPILLRLPSAIVFDHMGRIPLPAGTSHPAFATIGKLLDRGRTWVKLSGAYMETKVGPPTYADASELARAYLAAAPERMVWGSDWPHPTEALDKKPDDAILFDLLLAWAPDEAVRNRILVDNPATLYGFPKVA